MPLLSHHLKHDILMNTTQDLFVKMTLDNWNAHMMRFDKLLEALSDEQLQQDIAPGKNSGTYLLGHLTAVHDGMLPLLYKADKLYPELEGPYIKTPDKVQQEVISVSLLRTYWLKVNVALRQQFNATSSEEWFKKHAAVSEEDFLKEPHRNKLNVLISRTAHLAYHLGQVALLK
jgi:hypothetical protein